MENYHYNLTPNVVMFRAKVVKSLNMDLLKVEMLRKHYSINIEVEVLSLTPANQ